MSKAFLTDAFDMRRHQKKVHEDWTPIGGAEPAQAFEHEPVVMEVEFSVHGPVIKDPATCRRIEILQVIPLVVFARQKETRAISRFGQQLVDLEAVLGDLMK